MSLFSIALLLIASYAALASEVQSQDVERGVDSLVIGSEPTCGDCRVAIRRMTTLVSLEDPTSPAEQFVMTRDGRGRTFLAPMADRASVGVYGSTGRLRTEMGRPGEGPGEFRYAHEVKVLSGDTVLVLDGVLSRYSVFSPDLRFIETVRMPFPDQGAVAFNSRDLIVHANITTPERNGLLLHHVIDGEIVRSFSEVQAVPPGEPPEWRRIAMSTEGRVWSAHTDEYTIELWDTAGVREKTLIAERPWFSEPERTATLNGIWQDENGLLVILIDVEDEGGEPTDLQAEDRAISDSDFRIRQDAYMTTVIEVIDPVTGDLIASRISERLLNGGGLIDSPGYVTARMEDANGLLRVEVLAIRLERQ